MMYNKKYDSMPEIFSSTPSQKKDNVISESPTSPQEKTPEAVPHSTKKRNVDDYSEIMKREKPGRNSLLPFLPKPTDVCFDTQTSNEEIILVLRQHPITLLKKVGIIFFMVLFPIFFPHLALVDFFPASYQGAMILGWYTLTLGFALEAFLVWFFSVFIITDERIIDVDFLSLIFKDISSAKIDAIQDISSKTAGALASIVDYGTVYIQTAGESTEIQFENVPQPSKVAAILNELLLEEEKEKNEGRVH